MRHFFVLVAFLFAFNLQAQQLPSFPVPDLEEIPLYRSLKNNPSSIEIIYKEYDRFQSRMVEQELSIQLMLDTGKPRQVDYFVNGQLFLIYRFDEFERITEQIRVNGLIARPSYSYDEKTK